MQNIFGETFTNLEHFFLEHKEKKFKATQVYEWLYQKRVKSFQEMHNLKKETISLLEQHYTMNTITILTKQEGIDVVKYLLKLEDNNKIEAVLMKHNYGNSLCVSSQVGCNMSCTFCESGRLKKVRNLQTYEMVEQILLIEQDLKERISHIVLMGIGEPFDNYENIIHFIDIINHPKSFAIGSRHITISTCGVIPKIKEFMNYDKQVNLAVSLHAPNDTLRSKIMPINKVYPIKELLPVLKEYIKKTNRRITFEYILLDNVNDTVECAKELVNLLKGINCYVNLIPYNETSHIEYKKSKKENIDRFFQILHENKLNVTVRREFGSNVKAACGQLRADYEEEK